MRYRADPLDALRIVPLDSLTAIYQRRSGQTHLVADPVPEILRAFAGGEAGLAELLARLGIEESAEARAALTARLDEMVATGLAARA